MGRCDTDTVGTHRAEVEVAWKDGKIQTFPRDGCSCRVCLPIPSLDLTRPREDRVVLRSN